MTPLEAVNELLTDPQHYIAHSDEGYANGYVDALLDVLRKLDLLGEVTVMPTPIYHDEWPPE